MTVNASLAEYGDRVYFVGPVQVLDEPTPDELDLFAFQRELKASPGLESLREKAPNPHLLWLRGQYVEADQPNSNGDMWTAGDLAIASLTPVFQPCSVMHDFQSSSVGFVADARLLTPEKDDVPRARIDTTIAVWSHRYPQIAEEIKINASQGMLAQSMECFSSSYSCGSCGMVFQRQPQLAEREQWCEHLKGANGEKAARVLRNVTFSGVGLIFGTRGARPAFKDAQLEVAELAAMHHEIHASLENDDRKLRDEGNPSPRRTVAKIEVEQSEYEEKVAEAAKVPSLTRQVKELETERNDFKAKVDELEPVAQKVPELETKAQQADELQTKVETLEADKLKAEEERDEEKTKREAAEEEKNKATLREERMEALGDGFKAKLEKAPTTKARLQEQAAALNDDEWKARLSELEETLAIKADAPASPEDLANKGLFTTEQVAAAGLVQVPETNGTTASDASRRRQAIGGLARKFGEKKTTA